MPTIRITLTPESIADLDAICKRSGYTRSEQIAGMIDAAKVEESAHTCPTCGRQTDDITEECWDCMEKHSE